MKKLLVAIVLIGIIFSGEAQIFGTIGPTAGLTDLYNETLFLAGFTGKVGYQAPMTTRMDWALAGSLGAQFGGQVFGTMKEGWYHQIGLFGGGIAWSRSRNTQFRVLPGLIRSSIPFTYHKGEPGIRQRNDWHHAQHSFDFGLMLSVAGNFKNSSLDFSANFWDADYPSDPDHTRSFLFTVSWGRYLLRAGMK